MKQRLTALLLCAALLLTLFGCAASAASVDLMEGISPNPAPAGSLPGREGSAAVTQFGLDLFLQTAEQDAGNPMISPLSVITALAMTAQGAKGDTLAQMEQAFGLGLEDLGSWLAAFRTHLHNDEAYHLAQANAVWFKDAPSFAVEPAFLQANADRYGAGLYKAPFDDSTLRDINRWVEEHTGGMIKDMLSELPADSVMCLINALTFDGEWSKVYNERQVRERTFTTPSGEERTVDMMFSDEHKYLETDTATGFVKNYKGGHYAFAALLPREGLTPEQCAASLTGEELVTLLTNPIGDSVDVGLPKFQSDCSAELSGALKAMGMEHPFDSSLSDFSGIGTSTEGPLFISRVLHKTFISVDERGTKAGAATVVDTAPSAAAPTEDPKVVILDRPFLYFIFDTATGLPLFMGIVNDPA